MEKEKLETLLIDYIDGHLDETELKLAEEEIKSNEQARILHDQLKEMLGVMNEVSELNPPQTMTQAFEKNLREETRGSSSSKVIPFMPSLYKVAAAVVLVIISGGVGYWYSQQQKQAEELAAIKREMEQTRQLVMDRLSDDLSASQRMLGVQAAYHSVESDVEILDALIRVMNEDPNSNVRLAAIEALRKFQQHTVVRKALIEALDIQTDPLVQIALIHLMVEMQERGAVKSLEKIIEDNTVLPAVKDEAQAGLFKLT